MDQNILPFLVSESGEAKFTLNNREKTLGRAPDNDIVLEDAKCSRYHATINFISGNFILRDLNSSNGILINNIRLTSEYKLQNGDRIKFGNLIFIFKDPSPTENRFSASSKAPGSLLLDDSSLIMYLKRGGTTFSENLSGDMWVLLKELYSKTNEVCSYDSLIKTIYKNESGIGDRKPSLEKLIHGLRKKLRQDKKDTLPRIRTIRGTGYILET